MKNLDVPLDLSKILPNTGEATALYKSFADAIYENELHLLKDSLEPKFARLAIDKVKSAHKVVNSQLILDLNVLLTLFI